MECQNPFSINSTNSEVIKIKLITKKYKNKYRKESMNNNQRGSSTQSRRELLEPIIRATGPGGGDCVESVHSDQIIPTIPQIFNPYRLNNSLKMRANLGLTDDERWIVDNPTNRAKQIEFIIKRAIMKTLFYHQKSWYHPCCNSLTCDLTEEGTGHCKAFPSINLFLEKEEVEKIQKFKEEYNLTKWLKCEKTRKLTKKVILLFIKKLDLKKVHQFLDTVVPKYDDFFMFTTSKKILNQPCQMQGYLQRIQERGFGGDEEESDLGQEDSEESVRSVVSVDLVDEVRREDQILKTHLKKSSIREIPLLLVDSPPRNQPGPLPPQDFYFDEPLQITAQQRKDRDREPPLTFEPAQISNQGSLDDSVAEETLFGQLCSQLAQFSMEKKAGSRQHGQEIKFTPQADLGATKGVDPSETFEKGFQEQLEEEQEQLEEEEQIEEEEQLEEEEEHWQDEKLKTLTQMKRLREIQISKAQEELNEINELIEKAKATKMAQNQ